MTSTLSPMNEKRHADIRALLVTEADGGVPALRRRPVARRPAVALASATAVTVTVSVLLVADPAAPPSYAGWDAVPVTAAGGAVSSDDIEKWGSQCSDLGVGAVAVEGVPARKADAARREVLVDRRGDITYCVDVAMGGGTATDPLIALAGLRADGGRAEGLNTMSATVFDKPFDRPSPEGALLLGGDITTPPEPDEPDVIRLEAYQLYGLAGAEVTGVDIVLTNGLRITSTVRNGVWGAWWPTDRGDPTGVRLDVRTATGSRSVDPATIRLPWD